MPGTAEILANRLRYARNELGLTQDEVARTLGVRGATISDWERGLAKPNLDRLEQVARLYEKPLTFFFTAGENESLDSYTIEEIVGHLHTRTRAKTDKRGDEDAPHGSFSCAKPTTARPLRRELTAIPA